METKRILVTALFTVTLMYVSAVSTQAQVVYGQPAWGGVGLVYTNWSIDTDSTSMTLSQLYTPLSGFIPVQENFEVQFYIAGESNTLDVTTADESVSGLTDLRLQANHAFANDQFLLSGGVSLPTGKRELDPTTEQPIIEALSRDFLEFPVRRFGEGFGFNILGSVAREVNNTKLGLSIGYRFIGEYVPYEGTGDYNPGDQISVDLRAEVPGEQVTLTGGIGFTTYGADQVDGVKVFEQAPLLHFHGGAYYDAGDYGIGGGIEYMLRGDHTRYAADEIILEEVQLFGNEFSIRGQADFTLAEDWTLSPMARLRTIAANDFEESATVVGVGGSASRTLTETIGINAGLTYYLGNADGGDIDLSGIQLSGGVSATF